ncbi:PadR family transcriptional regulator [endosymbiont 'TC1' of Trimyema compressum]|uniref:PadR family transcriptional regulator n=1 Tax=endosymbiont 'TC1' of Trimyema compressum TaxID=243899 RepID=UPI0007F101CC|nr:PadR family transcriptional regulator [endosymbiont 'TC1' of Trimyema compressum]AMP20957.1 PadR family transcriptional regulator [endosymbiont 'TC1' of Trimyema compressum]
MDNQLKKGFLETCVLANLKKADSYGYKIIQEITPLIKTSESTLYPVLRRLEDKKLVSTYSKEYNGRLRKYYQLTATGNKKLNEFKKEAEHITHIMDYILEKGGPYE